MRRVHSIVCAATLLAGCVHETKIQAPNPCAIALAAQTDDLQINRWQQRARLDTNSVASLERLGWAYVAKARSSSDAGFYKLAEQCAECMKTGPEALLLRGHVYHSEHRFREAEAAARELVRQREMPEDFGLLGDALMEQGKLDEAVAAYQKMMDLKPSLHAYARVAHIRWLTGDLAGAIEGMQLALQAASPRDADSAAWVYSRMASYQLQAGNLHSALRHCDAALDFLPNYPAALLVRGRALLAKGEFDQAVETLRRAAQLNPLPDYLWTLADALRAAGKDAREVEAQIHAADDPRTVALYLATRSAVAALGERGPRLASAATTPATTTAVQLAREELKSRADVHTHDALAWALFAAGQSEEARREMKLALAAGTQDARLFLHAGLITGNQEFLNKARAMQQMLLPSERAALTQTQTPTGEAS